MTFLSTRKNLSQTKRPVANSLTGLALSCMLTAIIFSPGLSLAEVIDVPDAELTMNDELREDIYQTLYHLRLQHYTPNELNDEYSARTLDSYLDLLDPNKIYFTQKDIKKLEPYRFQIDDILKKRDAELGFDIFKIFRHRLSQRTEKIIELIHTDFDFELDEVINIDRDSYSWAVDQKALDEVWRKRIKNNTLQQMMAETPLEKIRDNLVRRYQRKRDVIYQLKADEVFEWFINAYAGEVGPHTRYMSDLSAENFRISMSLSLEGIGAALQSKDDYTVVNRVLPGGPAERGGILGEEDKIVGVGQEGEEMINVIGWRLMDVVKMIRGDKGTKVRLDIEPEGAVPGSPPEQVEFVRDIIHLEDQAAKLSQVELPKGKGTENYSVINIPSFYSNSGQAKAGAKYTATTHDVNKLLMEVNESDSKGLIIDLRGNGGGYLNEAISLTGLFIPQGPVVQVLQQNGKRSVLRDKHNAVAYDGPMVVLIDRYSASASEIFAAALQDYGRAMIVGERSFGKGTVQRVTPLRYGKNVEHESQIKFTTAQFFRVNGGSTQHKGVVPDILLNSGEEDEEFGERSYDNALPWSKTSAASFQSESIPQQMVSDVAQQHLQRSKKSPAFKLLRQNSIRIAENKDIKELSLNLKERKATRDELEQKSLDQLNAYRESLDLEPVTAETKSDNPLPNEDDHWDIVYHTEAARILRDQINWSNTMVTKSTVTAAAVDEKINAELGAATQ